MSGKWCIVAAIRGHVGASAPSLQHEGAWVMNGWLCRIGVSDLAHLQCPATKKNLGMEIERTKLEDAAGWKLLGFLPPYPRSQGAKREEIWPGACEWAGSGHLTREERLTIAYDSIFLQSVLTNHHLHWALGGVVEKGEVERC